MKTRIVFICLFFLICSAGNAKTILSEADNKPIIYASVGILNRNLGTVTDTLGRFSLKIPAQYQNDSIRISCVGYRTKTFSVAEFDRMPDTIRLADDVVLLSEVVVKPQKIAHKTAGRKGGGGFIGLMVEGPDAAGQGLAIPVNVKKRAWLKEIGFFIVTGRRTLKHMKFRVNIYRKEDGKYNLLNFKPIYFEYDKSQLAGDAFAYKFPDEISLEKGSYYVELEFLENFSNEYFLMASKPMTGRTRYRYASQSEWKTLPFGSPIYVDYDAVE